MMMRNPGTPRAQPFGKNLNQLELAQRAVRANDVAIALGELLVALAGAVATPHVLDLVALEGERQFVAVHDHKPCERHGQIVPQCFLMRGVSTLLSLLQRIAALAR